MKQPDIDRILDEAFCAVVGKPCRPVGPINRLEEGRDRRERIRPLLAEGWKLEAIAAELGIHEFSVRYHAKKIRGEP